MEREEVAMEEDVISWGQVYGQGRAFVVVVVTIGVNGIGMVVFG